MTCSIPESPGAGRAVLVTLAALAALAVAKPSTRGSDAPARPIPPNSAAPDAPRAPFTKVRRSTAMVMSSFVVHMLARRAKAGYWMEGVP
jgi:hypothetical protein